MALESASFISGLVSANPPGTDVISQGDDHLRLIKTVLKASLPNANAAINGIHTSAGVDPTSTSAGLLWFDTSANILYMRNEANDGWITLLASEGGTVLSTTHARLTGNADVRSSSYADTGLSISHTKITTASDLYIQFNIFQETYSNFTTSESNNHGYIILTDSSDTIITGTNNDQKYVTMESEGHDTSFTEDVGNTFSWLYKVTNANCPDTVPGAQDFKLRAKQSHSGDMGTSFSTGCTAMVWEVAT